MGDLPVDRIQPVVRLTDTKEGRLAIIIGLVALTVAMLGLCAHRCVVVDWGPTAVQFELSKGSCELDL